MSLAARRVMWGGTFAGILALTFVGLFKSRGSDPILIQVGPRSIPGIMGTQTEITAVVRADEEELGEQAHEVAEEVLRTMESRLSVHIKQSELGALNSAPAGQLVPMSPETVELLKRCRELTELTEGAFDPTAAPVFELWAEAGEHGRVPSPEDIRQAREQSTWDDFEFFPGESDGVMKRRDSAEVDLGAIAKGYAVDRAIEAMRSLGSTGGLVNVGGDMRFFGPRPGGDEWTIGLQDPFNPGSSEPMMRLRLPAAAVCTSGNYRRYSEVDGRRYSHIIDPRTGQPADTAPSVTVVAGDALAADAWATALSVLGPSGLGLVEGQESVEALVVVGDENEHHLYMTSGFGELILQSPGETMAEPPVASLP
ncbi:MAG: FAD:protein FMN transferase [Phycisphaerae bacterium]